MDNFTPSKYQKAIFDYIEHGQGHLVVEAAAGSGKTSTLIKCLELIPKDKKVLFTAFNRDIVAELKSRVNNMDNVDLRTLNGLGYAILKKNPMFLYGAEVDPFKYNSYLNSVLQSGVVPNMMRRLKWSDRNKYKDNIIDFINFGRNYLCQTEKDLDMIEDRYDIQVFGDEKEVAIAVMRWGKEYVETVDFIDQIWLPVELGLSTMNLKYDYILVDECQDMNKADRELIQLCFKQGTRLISVGDSNQCLYSFAGSDPYSFSELQKIPNTKSLPLSISYRCPKNVVNFAKRIVPSIEAKDDAEDGIVVDNVQLDEVKDGDMILCRNNAPLIKIYNEYLKNGVKCYIMGKDIGPYLIKSIKNTGKEELNVSCLKDGVFARLYQGLFETRDKMIQRSNIDEKLAMGSFEVQSRLDIIKSLEVLAEGLKTSEELIARIENIFKKTNPRDGGIALSTIHKAKGLEADNVYIACKSLMPSKSAKMDWEVRQEYNIMYVAYTRAKKKLGFIDEREFDVFDTFTEVSMTEMKRIEECIRRLFGTPENTITKEYVDYVTKNRRIVDTTAYTTNSVNMDGFKKKEKTFSEMRKKRVTKRKRL